MRSSLTVLCFVIVGFVRGITVDERLNEFERIIREQNDKLETVQNENYMLRNRVDVLENAIEQLNTIRDNDNDESNTFETDDDQLDVNEDERRDASIQRAESQVDLQAIPHRRSPTSENVAFYAHNLADPCLNNGEVLVFGVVAIDVGNGYSTGTGVYVVPVTGTYVFTWTATARQDWYNADIMVNGYSRGRATPDGYADHEFVQVTGLIVTNVVAGNQVYIKRFNGAGVCNGEAYDAGLSTFAGWLLF